MGSASLADWHASRAQGLDRLRAAHRAYGVGPGRRWLTEGVNHALLVRLAAEFQGYCRDLHDEAIDVLVLALNPTAAMEPVFRAALQSNRKLDVGNANWSNVCADFARFGITLSQEMQSAYRANYSQWVERLALLNEARNAIAHDDQVALRKLKRSHRLTLRTFDDSRRIVGRVAIGLDAVVGAYFNTFTGIAPW